MKRVFEIDVLVCPHCEGQRELIAFLTDGLVVRKILLHLGLDSEPPIQAPARTLEESVFAWVARDGEKRFAGLDQARSARLRECGCGERAHLRGEDALTARKTTGRSAFAGRERRSGRPMAGRKGHRVEHGWVGCSPGFRGSCAWMSYAHRFIARIL